MSWLAKIKDVEEDHYQPNVVREELKTDLKVHVQPVVTTRKVPPKKGYGKGGSYTCPIWMKQLILEQLINGTPLADILTNIASQAALDITRVKVIGEELTSINFFWSCRKILWIIVEILEAYCIGKVELWDKLFSDSTGRCNTAHKNLVIGIIDEERLRPLILSTSIILKGHMYEQHVNAVI